MRNRTDDESLALTFSVVLEMLANIAEKFDSYRRICDNLLSMRISTYSFQSYSMFFSVL